MLPSGCATVDPRTVAAWFTVCGDDALSKRGAGGNVAAMPRFRNLLNGRSGRAGGLALLALFWFAQLHGIQHGISHLGDAPRGGSTPHSLVCADCLASAESGAAPLPATLVPILAVLPASLEPLPPVVVADRDVTTSYRSRAPPAAPI